MKKLAAVVVLLAAAVSVSACGGGSTSAPDAAAAKDQIYPWLKGPSRQFLIPGGDNAVQTFGEEATAKERARATAVIAAWLEARAAKDWHKDCSYFSHSYAKSLTKDAHGVTQGKVDSCAEALAYFKGNASGDYVNTLRGSVASLRVGKGFGTEGKSVYLGYAQYHGNDGRDWVVPLEREAGEWKVAHSRPFGRNE